MRKKLTKKIQSLLPQMFDRNGEPINRVNVANKILDNLTYSDRLDLQPFERWIPLQCAGCTYNDANRMGCTYALFSEDKHFENPAPDDCPLEY